MKLAFILGDMRAGGIQKTVFKLLEGNKYDQHVILLNDVFEQDNKLSTPYICLNYSNKRSITRSKLIKLIKYAKAVCKLRKHLLVNKTDILVCFGYSVIVISILSMLFMKKRPSIVANIRNSITELNLTKVKPNIFKALTLSCCRRCDVIIAVSKGIKQELVLEHIPAGKVHVIYNGYDIDAISRMMNETIEEKDIIGNKMPVVITAGRLSPQKNYDMLIKALQHVNNTLRCKLVIIGEGENEALLKELSCKLGLQDRVEFIGYKTNPYKYISRADIFVLSSYFEGFPNVLCEAMLCGLPVISTDCPTGPNEIIINGWNGILVPVGDHRSMGDAILELLTNEDLRKKMAYNAFESAKKFTVDKMVNDYNKLFKDIITTRHSCV